MKKGATFNWQASELLDTIDSSTRKRLFQWANDETLLEVGLVSVTLSLLTTLFYVFYHALQNYRVF